MEYTEIETFVEEKKITIIYAYMYEKFPNTIYSDIYLIIIFQAIAPSFQSFQAKES